MSLTSLICMIFFQIFFTSKSTEILIKPNFFLGMYMPYIPNAIMKAVNTESNEFLIKYVVSCLGPFWKLISRFFL